MTTTESRSRDILSRKNYAPRTAGYLLGFVSISTVFYFQHVGIFYWIYAISFSFIWPHLAYFIGMNSYNANKTEIRILFLDSMLIGTLLPLTSFNILPSATFFIMQSLNTMGTGGLRLFLKGTGSFIFGVLIIIPFTGLNFKLETNLLIMVACIPSLIMYPLTIAFLGYLTSLKLNKTRANLKLQKAELEDAYAEIETTLQETKTKEQEIANINQVVQTINSTLDLDAVLASVANALQQIFSFNQIAIMVIDKEQKELFFEKSYGEGFTADQVEKCKKVKFPLRKEIAMCCYAALKNKLYYIPDITPEMVGLFLPADKQIYEITHCKSYLFCPLEFQKKVIGVMAFGDNRQSFKLTESDLDKIQRYVNQIASAIQNARVFKELNEAKQIAEAATKSKSNFLATMSHEIRTPMNAILGMSELLSEMPLTCDQENLVGTISASGELLLSIINDILDFSKIESGQIELEKTVFDVNDLGTTSCKMLSVNADEKNLDLSCRVSPDIQPFRVGDPTRLRQIIINLLSNAIKFTPQGEVVLEVVNSDDPELLEFCVRDTGIGVPVNKQQSIFESFTQADTSTTRKFGGTGLGLAICKRLVELMGGRIWVESEEGKGTRFFFTARFPETDQIPKSSTIFAKGAKPGLKPEEIILPPLRILLAEDVENNRKLIKLYLKSFPIRVDVAENGAVALEKFRKNDYNLVLMDSEMPEMDGFSATRAIRKWEKKNSRPETPVVALTAHAFAEYKQQSMDAGCNGYLTKPIKKYVLIEKILQFAGSGPVMAQDGERTCPNQDAPPNSIHNQESRSFDFIVKIDAELKALIPDFMAQTRNDLTAMSNALKKQDSETLRRIGHSLKGSAWMYEFKYLGNLGMAIEEAAKRNDLVEIAKVLEKLNQYLEKMQIAYI